MPDTPSGFPPAQHLRIKIDDIAQSIPGYAPPNIDHVRTLIAFARDWDRQGSAIVHCYAGVSRSMAAALIMMSLDRPGSEAACAAYLRQHAPHAQPNKAMINLADLELNLAGRLKKALIAMGPPDPQYSADLVTLPVALSPSD